MEDSVVGPVDRQRPVCHKKEPRAKWCYRLDAVREVAPQLIPTKGVGSTSSSTLPQLEYPSISMPLSKTISSTKVMCSASSTTKVLERDSDAKQLSADSSGRIIRHESYSAMRFLEASLLRETTTRR